MNRTAIQGLEQRRTAVPLLSDRPYESDLFADVVLVVDVSDDPDGSTLLRRALDAANAHPVIQATMERAEGVRQREPLVGSVASLARRTAHRVAARTA